MGRVPGCADSSIGLGALTAAILDRIVSFSLGWLRSLSTYTSPRFGGVFVLWGCGFSPPRSSTAWSFVCVVTKCTKKDDCPAPKGMLVPFAKMRVRQIVIRESL